MANTPSALTLTTMIIKDADPTQAKRILTMMKNIGTTRSSRGLQMHLEGTTPYGTAEALGIAEGGVGLARNEYYDKHTPEEVKKLLNEAEQKVINSRG